MHSSLHFDHLIRMRDHHRRHEHIRMARLSLLRAWWQWTDTTALTIVRILRFSFDLVAGFKVRRKRPRPS
jgi:hypothetical protein